MTRQDLPGQLITEIANKVVVMPVVAPSAAAVSVLIESYSEVQIGGVHRQ